MQTTPKPKIAAHPAIPAAPSHLSPEAAEFWVHHATELDCKEHHLVLLTLLCEAMDRTRQAREAIARHGMTFTDSRNNPRPRPEIAIERDSRLAVARLTRELGLDLAGEVEAPRPNHLPGRRRS